MDACILTAIVCKCDEQMDRHVIMILRYNKIINCYKYFTNLVIGIAVGAARHIYIYTIYLHTIYNTVLLALILVGIPGTITIGS